MNNRSQLIRCARSSGEVEVRNGEPSIALCRNAIYVPVGIRHISGYDPFPFWGLYHQDGSIISEAAYRRGPKNALVGQSEILPLEHLNATETVTDECIYLGPLYHHYGHHVVASLGRSWFLLSGRKGKFVCHSYTEVKALFELPFVSQTFGAIGVSASDIIAPNQTTLFKNIVVPGPSFQELSFAYDIHSSLCKFIGKKVCPNYRSASRQPIFLSKRHLDLGIWRFVNEDLLVEALEDNGVLVAYPEQLSFNEQVEIFSNYQYISGIAGSALHTTLFSSSSKEILGLCFESSIPSNFELIDRIASNKASYFYPSRSTRLENPAPFHVAFELDDAAGVAEALVAEMTRRPSPNAMFRDLLGSAISKMMGAARS